MRKFDTGAPVYIVCCKALLVPDPYIHQGGENPFSFADDDPVKLGNLVKQSGTDTCGEMAAP
jgi:hypothetical protein